MTDAEKRYGETRLDDDADWFCGGVYLFGGDNCKKCAKFFSTYPDDLAYGAFPDYYGIPKDIWFGRIDHRQPYLGDGGVRFEEKSETGRDET